MFETTRGNHSAPFQVLSFSCLPLRRSRAQLDRRRDHLACIVGAFSGLLMLVSTPMIYRLRSAAIAGSAPPIGTGRPTPRPDTPLSRADWRAAPRRGR